MPAIAKADASLAETAIDAGATDAGEAPIPLIDSPVWPAGARRVLLTWVVHPSVIDPSNPDNENLVPRPIELEVSVGSVTRRVSLRYQPGTVPRKHQKPCALKLGPETLRSAMALRSPEDLAALAFGVQGDYGYEVRRDTDVTIAVLAFSQDDGLCPDESGEAQRCPRQSAVVARVQVPESAAFEERVIGIDRTGKEFPFCQGHDK